ncbi:MAG: hypothetical protein WC565_08630, partial [Parcubacteria group bacterium]
LTEVQRRDRACLFGIYKTNARLRAALDMLRVQATPEIAPGWVGIPETEWSGVLMLLDHDGLLTSLPPSDMRLVPVERLREIEWSANEDGWPACPACGGLEGCAHKPDCWLGAILKNGRNNE